MDAAAMDYVPYRTANIVANVRPDGPVEIAAYDSNWNVMIILTMMKVSVSNVSCFLNCLLNW